MLSIKTPDQKLRVFISSTINELAEERKLAREAISKLRLIPVLFEMGARPHPPRELYRAYLEQSQIFVGFYGNSYGWIAPDMEISGLEDEYLLSGTKPKLIYVKRTKTPRQPRLEELLSKIQESGVVCYQNFSNAAELRELLENDLALLLSERFEAELESSELKEGRKNYYPVIRSSLIGRDSELLALRELLAMPEVGLITITGTGGTGKTRLALQLIREEKENYKDGVFFVSLAAISNPQLTALAIAQVLGLFDSGRQPIRQILIEYLQDKKILLVLDNFEQILDAGLLVSEISEHCLNAKVLITSRTPLHVRGEYVFPLEPLSNPHLRNEKNAADIVLYPAVQLFIQRAKEVNPALTLDDQNIIAISTICSRLDGLPLAIELAAARTKFLSPSALLKRMEKTLDILAHGQLDLPQRQQTFRATIDWSYSLLDENCRRFFRRLGIFNEGWTLEAAKEVADWGDLGGDVSDFSEKLFDTGLLRSVVDENNLEPRFVMLQVLREYALETLEKNSELTEAKKSHADYYVTWLNTLEPNLWKPTPLEWTERIEHEYQNIHAAFLNSLGLNMNNCWQICGALTNFWVNYGRLSEAFDWMEKAAVFSEAAIAPNYTVQVDKAFRARAFFGAGALKTYSGEYKLSLSLLELALALYTELGNWEGVARCKTYIGISMISLGDMAVIGQLKEAMELAHKINDVYSIIASSTFLTEVLSAIGEYDQANLLLKRTEQFAKDNGSIIGQAFVRFQKGNQYFSRGELEKAIPAYRQSIDLFAQGRYNSVIGWAFVGLGCCLTELKKYDEAVNYLRRGLAHARERGERAMMTLALFCFAGYAAHTGKHAVAARLYGAVEILKESAEGYGTWGSNRKVVELGSRILESLLVMPGMQAEFENGKRLNSDQAIALCLEI